MQVLIRLIDTINARIGRGVAWLSLGLVLVYFAVVLLRYAFDFGSIAMQESASYLHALIFMGAAAYTLQNDAHVRVDIFYGRWSPRGKARVDLFGSLFLLLPFAACLLIFSWNYVGAAWGQLESSAEPGGLPFVYLLKTVILVMALQLMLQALAQGMKALLSLRASS